MNAPWKAYWEPIEKEAIATGTIPDMKQVFNEFLDQQPLHDYEYMLLGVTIDDLIRQRPEVAGLTGEPEPLQQSEVSDPTPEHIHHG